MHNILLHSCVSGGSKDIRHRLAEDLPYPVQLAQSESETLEILSRRAKDLIVIDTNLVYEQELSLLRQLKSRDCRIPILMLARDVRGREFAQLQQEMKLHLLYKPFSQTHLFGLIKKLIYTNGKLPQQKYKRYRTNQDALIEPLMEGAPVKTSIYNLSIGGAYFEFRDLPRLNVGDLVRVRVQLNEVSSSHTLNGKIVWATPSGHVSGHHGVGVKFMNFKDIYRDLMGQV